VKEKDLRAQGKGIIIGFSFCRSKMCREVIDMVVYTWWFTHGGVSTFGKAVEFER
jgi:hypothetical protein